VDRAPSASPGRPTAYRGLRVIRVSKSRHYYRGDSADLLPDLPAWDRLDFGALVGLVDLDCLSLAEVEGESFALGPWCGIFSRPRCLRPVPFSGQVRFFIVPENLVQKALGATRIDPGESRQRKRLRDQGASEPFTRRG
jgi:hypothetical protein